MAGLLAERSSLPAAHMSLDDVRDWVKSGYANPEVAWNEQASLQYAIARRICATAARQHVDCGHSCVIDDAIFPDWPEVSLEGWLHDLGELPVDFVAIMADKETLLQRNRQRSGHRRLLDEVVGLIHEQMEGWRTADVSLVDTTSLTIDEAAQRVVEAVSGRDRS